MRRSNGVLHLSCSHNESENTYRTSWLTREVLGSGKGRASENKDRLHIAQQLIQTMTRQDSIEAQVMQS